MFAAKMPKSWFDIAAEEGEAGLLLKIMEGFEDFRPGGFTCNLCSKKVAPTEFTTVDFKTGKVEPGSAGKVALKNAEAMIKGKVAIPMLPTLPIFPFYVVGPIRCDGI